MAAHTLTLTNLIPDIYNAMNVVSRELVGMIPAVSRDSSAERAAKDQVVRSPVVGAMTAEDLTVDNVSATAPDQAIDNVSITISKFRSVPFGITAEREMLLNNAGMYGNINQQRIAQALRTLTNEVEADLVGLHKYASRAYGTASTVPFGTANNLSDFAGCRKILDDNGSPQSDLHMILDSTMVANLRGIQTGLLHVNEAGSSDLLRWGSIAEPISGFALHNSAQIKEVTGGTAASATTDTTGYAVGATEITLASAGTGTFITGDVITFANDTNKYVVKTGDTDVSGGGKIVLQEPGLKQALPASAVAITVVEKTAGTGLTRGLFFHRSAIQLATRAPAMPSGGDSADDVMLVTDPISGISYEFCVYKQKRQVRFEVNLAWGCAVTAPRHLGLLVY